jgi:hypothetical protein
MHMLHSDPDGEKAALACRKQVETNDAEADPRATNLERIANALGRSLAKLAETGQGTLPVRFENGDLGEVSS